MILMCMCVVGERERVGVVDGGSRGVYINIYFITKLENPIKEERKNCERIARTSSERHYIVQGSDVPKGRKRERICGGDSLG